MAKYNTNILKKQLSAKVVAKEVTSLRKQEKRVGGENE